MDTRLPAPRKEKALETTVRKKIEALRHMTVGQLKKKYAEVFGEETRPHHKHFLFRCIACQCGLGSFCAQEDGRPARREVV